MDSNKKPSEPSEAERWAKMENEIQKLKRSRSILCVSSFVQSLLLWRIIGQINQIRELLTLLVRFDALVSQHLYRLNSIGKDVLKYDNQQKQYRVSAR